MRKAVLDLIESYQIPVDEFSDLFILEMVDAAGTLVALKYPGEGNHFVKQANSLITTIEIEAAKQGELIYGTRTMLSDLKSHNIKTGVVTRNCQSAVTCVFPDIHMYCDAVVTREATRKVKPHPEHLLTVLKLLDVTPACASMVGDHPMDIKIGKDVGTFTIGVLSGYSTSSELLQAGADVIIHTAANIINVLP